MEKKEEAITEVYWILLHRQLALSAAYLSSCDIPTLFLFLSSFFANTPYQSIRSSLRVQVVRR